MQIIFENVTMYDGTGKNPGKLCDVGVDGERIAAIGDLKAAEAEKRIDCTGLSMFPGMIDVHTHSDLAMFNDSHRDMAVSQGITTEIVSACGIGLVPMKPELQKEYVKLMEALTGPIPENGRFESVDAYFETMPKTGVNVAMQLAHSPLRAAAAGSMKDTPLTDDMWKIMEKLEREAFEQGAVSISTGMSYFPATFCETSELVKMCKVAKDYDAPLSVHQRSTLRKPDPTFNSVEEVLTVARESGAKLVYSHYRTGPWNPGLHEAVCEPIERGHREGLQIFADFYPYDYGCSYAPMTFPIYAMDGGYDGLMGLLNDPVRHEALAREMESQTLGRLNGVFIHCPKHPELLGRSYQDVAKEYGTSPERLILRILQEEDLKVANIGGTGTPKEVMDTLDEDFAYYLTKDYYAVGSDTIPCHELPHPRCYGAFARIFEIARKHNVPLEIVANRTSGNGAELYKLKDRGIIKVGNFADLMIFDADTIASRATFENPRQFATGVKYVTVNGKFAMEDGKLTGVTAGRALRRGV